MEQELKGRYQLKIDAKGRLSLPAALKEQFPNSTFVVTNSQYQGSRCLDVYPVAHWQELEQKINKMSSLKREVQAFQRFYIAGGQQVEADGQSRVLVPRGLRDYAALEGEVVLVGMGNKFELWNLQAWEKIFDNLATSFEDTLGAIADFDVGA